jgi:hypothetical protein
MMIQGRKRRGNLSGGPGASAWVGVVHAGCGGGGAVSCQLERAQGGRAGGPRPLSTRRVIEARWGSKPLPSAGQLQPRRLNTWPVGAPGTASWPAGRSACSIPWPTPGLCVSGGGCQWRWVSVEQGVNSWTPRPKRLPRLCPAAAPSRRPPPASRSWSAPSPNPAPPGVFQRDSSS